MVGQCKGVDDWHVGGCPLTPAYSSAYFLCVPMMHGAFALTMALTSGTNLVDNYATRRLRVLDGRISMLPGQPVVPIDLVRCV